MTAEIYEETIHENAVKQFNDTLFMNNTRSSNKIQRQLTSQNIVKNGSQTMFPHLLEHRTGQSGSPDLNPFWNRIHVENAFQIWSRSKYHQGSGKNTFINKP